MYLPVCVLIAQPVATDRANQRSFITTDSVFSFTSPKGFFPCLWKDFKVQAVSPSKMKGRDFTRVGAALIITGGMFLADYSVDKEVRTWEERYEWIDQAGPQISRIGFEYGIIFTGAWGIAGLIRKDHLAFRTSIAAGQAAITSLAWTFIFKTMTGRMRPEATYTDEEYPRGHWFGPFARYRPAVNEGRSSDYFTSFSSAHSAFAFSVATVFAQQYRSAGVAVTGYTLATLVAISRMTEHRHWMSDAAVGAAIGTLCGLQVTKREKKLFGGELSRREKKNRLQAPELAVFADPAGGQLSLRWRW